MALKPVVHLCSLLVAVPSLMVMTAIILEYLGKPSAALETRLSQCRDLPGALQWEANASGLRRVAFTGLRYDVEELSTDYQALQGAGFSNWPEHFVRNFLGLKISNWTQADLVVSQSDDNGRRRPEQLHDAIALATNTWNISEPIMHSVIALYFSELHPNTIVEWHCDWCFDSGVGVCPSAEMNEEGIPIGAEHIDVYAGVPVDGDAGYPQLTPLQVIASGYYAPTTIRFHIPLTNVEEAEFRVAGTPMNLLSQMMPGELYIVDTLIPHMLLNTGNKTRVHLVVDIDSSDLLSGKLDAVPLGMMCRKAAEQMGYGVPDLLRARLRLNGILNKYLASFCQPAGNDVRSTISKKTGGFSEMALDILTWAWRDWEHAKSVVMELLEDADISRTMTKARYHEKLVAERVCAGLPPTT